MSITCREKLEKEYPEKISNDFLGGCAGCPHEYGYLFDQPGYCADADYGAPDKRCSDCWDREIPEEKEEKENKPMKKTKAMLEEELEQKRTEIEDLKKELVKAEKYKQYDDMAGEIKAIYDSLVNAGFNEDQAFVLLNTMINNQKSAPPIRPSYRPYK